MMYAIEHTPDRLLIRMKDRFTFSHQFAFNDVLTLIRSSSAAAFAIDLSELTFIDSTGVGLIVLAHHEATQKKKPFAVVNAQGQALRLLKVMNLGAIMTVEAAGLTR